MLYVVLLGELHCIALSAMESVIESVMESCIDMNGTSIPVRAPPYSCSMHASAAYICSTHFRYYATTGNL